jgi:cellulose synthase/poly-beta-1,6-N-acetylglucosamine synthase-like glycosyltransferase
VLPFLGIMHLPMPLGGTSNHFRVSTLRAVGGWDPHNVTEDADLGLRLCRLGYLSEMISRSTLEDAPTEKSVWLGQRTRWFKGWMQTWLVIMRRPVAVAAELGLGGVMMFHMLITGMLISALFHPLILVFLATALWQMAFGEPFSGLRQALFVLDCVNAAGSYLLFAVVGYGAMIGAERQSLGTNWRYVPFYWMMMSWAAWRALYELHTRPFFWKKTPHRPSVRVVRTDG